PLEQCPFPTDCGHFRVRNDRASESLLSTQHRHSDQASATWMSAPPFRADARIASITCILARPSAKVATCTAEEHGSPRIAASMARHSWVYGAISTAAINCQSSLW